MNFNLYKYIGAIFLGLFCSTSLLATHVIGGNIQYRCLGNDQYEITVEFAVDCALGDGEALALDSFATVKVFDTENNWLTDLGDGGQWTIQVQDVLQLGDPNVACRVLNDPVCVQRQRYVRVVTLPFNELGYILSFRRCCRNSTLLNVVDPLDTGGTYWIELTPEAQSLCNNAARFRNWADVYACANEDLEFDASAIDIDGDSLVYKLCVPTEGGSDADALSNTEYFPPFQNVTFTSGFDVNNFLGVGTPLALDSQTGLLTVNAGLVGQFIVGICVEEYRDGVKISETRRDFEYNVRLCTDPPLSDFAVDPNPNCDGLTVSFENMSESTQGNPLEYQWFFDFPSLSQTTEEEDPSYTFPESGLYDIVLVTFDGICQDTAFATVAVSEPNDPSVNFALASSTGCGDTDIEFEIENLTSTSIGIDSWQWSVTTDEGTTNYDTQVPPPITVSQAQTVTVNLLATNIAGCTDQLEMQFDVTGVSGPELGPFLTNYVTSTCSLTPIVLNPSGNPNWNYEWSANPTASFDQFATSPSLLIAETTVFSVVVTDEAGCTAEGMVTVEPGDGPPLAPEIDNFNAIQCTQMALLLNPSPNTSYTYMWASSDPSIPINPILPSPTVLVTQPTSFTVTVTDIGGCTSVGQVNVSVQSGPPIDIINSLVQCEGDSVSLNPNFNASYEFLWESTPEGILEDPADPNPTVSVDELTMFNLTITDPLNPECPSSTFVNVLFAPSPEISIEPDTSAIILCQGETQFFDVTTDGNMIVWLDVNGDTISTEEDFELTAEDYGMYTVVSTSLFGCSNSAQVEIVEPDLEDIQITTISGSTVYCDGDEVTLIASTDSLNVNDFQWLDANGNTIGTTDTLVVFPNGDNVYFAEGATDDGCQISGEFQVSQSNVEAEITGPTALCQGEEALLESTILEGEGVTYLWEPQEAIIGSNTESTVTILPNSPNTVYSLTTVNAEGCTFTSLHTVSLLMVNNVVVSAEPNDIFFGQSTQLMVNPDIPGSTYEWSPSGDFDDPFSANPTVTPSTAGQQTYTVTVVSPDGCEETFTFFLEVREVQCRIENFYVPNMFTPNGDGHNDVFEVHTNAVDDFDLLVFNRWGETVFDSSNSNVNGWDGRFEGIELAPDVYGYCVSVNCAEGEEFVKTGNVTLVK